MVVDFGRKLDTLVTACAADADPDIPIQKQAKAGYAKLQ